MRDDGPGFHLERTETGVTLVVSEQWTEEASRLMDSGVADGLDLNYAKGFKDTNLEFIRPWNIKRVKILARTVQDLSPLYRLSGTLEDLRVEVSPIATIDLAEFPDLTRLAADWTQVQDSIGTLAQLRDLFLRAYSEPDLVPLGSNAHLERLRFKNRTGLRSLKGVEALRSLMHLGIYLARDLRDLAGLDTADQLRILHLEASPGVRDLKPVTYCHSLRFLNASDCRDIDSLSPLASLDALEVLWLFGTTRILDNDLSPIAGLPRLRELRMQSRNSYRPSVPMIEAAIARRIE